MRYSIRNVSGANMENVVLFLVVVVVVFFPHIFQLVISTNSY